MNASHVGKGLWVCLFGIAAFFCQREAAAVVVQAESFSSANDTTDETFTLQNVATLVTYARQVGIAGLHHWSFDRDRDCAPGFASPICNTYGAAGTLGFTAEFLSRLGQ